MVWAYNLGVSIAVGLLLLPLWFSRDLIDSSTQIIVSTVGLPTALILLNLFLFLKGKIKSLRLLYLIVPVSCLVNQLIEYISWGVSTGGLWQPDGETIGLLMLLSTVAVGVSLLLLVIMHSTLKIFGSKMSLGKKLIAWMGAFVLIGIAAFIFVAIIYNIF